jgi:hypothetical protein
MITELASNLQKAKEKVESNISENKEDNLKYGSDKVALNNYTNGIRLDALVKTLENPLKQKKLKDKVLSLARDGRISAEFIADNSRALVASLDNSFFGRQGIKVLLRPDTAKIWWKAFSKSFGDIYKVLKSGTKTGDEILDSIKAEIYGRPNARNGRYGNTKQQLDVGMREEDIPTSAPAKIPLFGRLFKASEVAYAGGAMRMRADLADKFYDMANKAGKDLSKKEEVAAINDLVNIMTGRGNLGRMESWSSGVNKVFFSIKFFKANIDTLIKPATAKTSFARKQAAYNLLSMTAIITIVLAIANALNPDSVEEDPRSSDFGKIKVGNTRVDITGGIGSILILVARGFSQSYKSSTTGLLSKYGEDYMSPVFMDAIWDFTENKFSPMASMIKEIANQKTFEGDKVTFMTSLQSLTVPIIAETIIDANEKEGLATALMAMIIDGLGLSVNIYDYQTNWNTSTAKDLVAFKEKVGENKFVEANDKYNKLINEYINDMKTDKTYQKLTEEEKRANLTKKKSQLKNSVFSKYGFKY